MSYKDLSVSFLLLFFSALVFSCNNAVSNTGLMPDTFWGKGDMQDLPQMFESVCDPKPDECGDTHFGANGDHYIVYFQVFDNEQKTQAAFEGERRKSSHDVREGEIKDAYGNIVGKKFVQWEDQSDKAGRYKLIWTRGKRFALVTAEKLESINAYEIDRRL